MACFSCGASFNETDIQRVAKYKQYWDEKGVSSYFFRLKTGGELLLVRANGFNTVLENEIKPNFENGAEWAHISEFNPNEL